MGGPDEAKFKLRGRKGEILRWEGDEMGLTWFNSKNHQLAMCPPCDFFVNG